MCERETAPTPALRSLTRRRFMQSTGAVGVSTVAPGVVHARSDADGAGDYPVKPIIALDELAPGATVPFSYPDERSPALLLRMNESASEGIGPDSSIVAFSSLCTHKGCPVIYRPEHRLLICPCHWSTFDPMKTGGLVIGQASQSLPRIELAIESGVIAAVGVEGLIYGRHTNLV